MRSEERHLLLLLLLLLLLPLLWLCLMACHAYNRGRSSRSVTRIAATLRVRETLLAGLAAMPMLLLLSSQGGLDLTDGHTFANKPGKSGDVWGNSSIIVPVRSTCTERTPNTAGKAHACEARGQVDKLLG